MTRAEPDPGTSQALPCDAPQTSPDVRAPFVGPPCVQRLWSVGRDRPGCVGSGAAAHCLFLSAAATPKVGRGRWRDDDDARRLPSCVMCMIPLPSVRVSRNPEPRRVTTRGPRPCTQYLRCCARLPHRIRSLPGPHGFFEGTNVRAGGRRNEGREGRFGTRTGRFPTECHALLPPLRTPFNACSLQAAFGCE